MSYRKKTAIVLWPEIDMATDVGTPDRTRYSCCQDMLDCRVGATATKRGYEIVAGDSDAK